MSTGGRVSVCATSSAAWNIASSSCWTKGRREGRREGGRREGEKEGEGGRERVGERKGGRVKRGREGRLGGEGERVVHYGLLPVNLHVHR